METPEMKASQHTHVNTTPSDESNFVTSSTAVDLFSTAGTGWSDLKSSKKAGLHAKTFARAVSLSSPSHMSMSSDSRCRLMSERTHSFMRQHTREKAVQIIYAVTQRLTVKRAPTHPEISTRLKCASATCDELTMQREIKTLWQVHKANVANANVSRIYLPHMSSKEKFPASSDFDEIKARATAGGDRVESGTVGETNSPAMITLSLTMIPNVTIFMTFEVSTHDVMGVFLTNDLVVDERPTYLRLEEAMDGFIPDAKLSFKTGTDHVYFRVMLYSSAPP